MEKILTEQFLIKMDRAREALRKVEKGAGDLIDARCHFLKARKRWESENQIKEIEDFFKRLHENRIYW